MRDNILLEVKNLKKHFPTSTSFFGKVRGYVKAVDGVNFTIKRGEVFGLVGESGCGKSTTSLSILRAIDPTDGQVLFHDRDKIVDLAKMSRKELLPYRKKIQAVFQDPYSSLNSRMTIKEIVSEPLVIHNKEITKSEIEERVKDLLENVGLNAKYMNRYPHAFSGGQRQRIAIARALSINPEFLVCDESVSALDVSIQGQILNLLRKLQKEMELTYLFIAHDLSVIKHICDRVGVMYVGRIVEYGETEDLYKNPKHPYTESLLSAIPKIDRNQESKRVALKGDVPDPANPPSGCYFHPRCIYTRDRCKNEYPEFRKIKGSNSEERYTSCHFAEGLDLEGIKEVEKVV